MTMELALILGCVVGAFLGAYLAAASLVRRELRIAFGDLVRPPPQTLVEKQADELRYVQRVAPELLDQVRAVQKLEREAAHRFGCET